MWEGEGERGDVNCTWIRKGPLYTHQKDLWLAGPTECVPTKLTSKSYCTQLNRNIKRPTKGLFLCCTDTVLRVIR